MFQSPSQRWARIGLKPFEAMSSPPSDSLFQMVLHRFPDYPLRKTKCVYFTETPKIVSAKIASEQYHSCNTDSIVIPKFCLLLESALSTPPKLIKK